MDSPLCHGTATFKDSVYCEESSLFQARFDPSSGPSYSYSSASRFLELKDVQFRTTATVNQPLRSRGQTMATNLQDLTLSDPGDEDSSDSDSECSFETPKLCSQSFLANICPEDEDFLLPSSILFQSEVMEQTLWMFKIANLIGRNLPNHLHDNISAIRVRHDPFSRTLLVLIGNMDGSRSQEEMHPCYTSRADIKRLGISISDKCNGISTDMQFEFLIWFLKWSQIMYGNTIEEVSIKVPLTFSLHKDTSSAFNELAVFPNLLSLTWTGGSNLVPYFISRFITGKTQTVAILETELSVDDALDIAHLLTCSNIFSLELGVITTCSPRIAGRIEESEDRSPILLRKLDTFKLYASVCPTNLFTALSLPSLCRCEFSFSSCGPQGENALRLLVASPLLGPNVLYVDVELQGPFVGMTSVMAQLKKRSPFAYASFRKR